MGVPTYGESIQRIDARLEELRAFHPGEVEWAINFARLAAASDSHTRTQAEAVALAKERIKKREVYGPVIESLIRQSSDPVASVIRYESSRGNMAERLAKLERYLELEEG